VSSSSKDVHTEHCCVNCGCKYGEDTPEYDPYDKEEVILCSVASGRKKQSYPVGETSVCHHKTEINDVEEAEE